jgi:hypothetical protein
MLELKKEMERLHEEYRVEMRKNAEYMQKLKEATEEDMRKINAELQNLTARRRRENAGR